MQYFQITKDKYIEYDEKTDRATVIIPSQIETSVLESSQRLNEIPPEPTDAEFLAWGKANMPRTDYSAERLSLEQIIDVNTKRLEAIK